MPALDAPHPPRRRRARRRALVAAAVLATVAGAGALAFGPFVRHEVAREASRRHLEVEVGSVRPSWLGVRLVDVRARPEGVRGVACAFDEVRVDFGSGGRSIVVHGGRIDARGTVAELRAEVAAWRAKLPAGAEGAHGARAPIRAENVSAHWDAGDEGSVDADGVEVGRSEGGMWVRAAHARVSHHGASGAANGVTVALDEHLALRHARAESADVTLERASSSSDAAEAPSAGRASAPLVDLASARARLDRLAARIAERLPEGAGVDVDALTFRAPALPPLPAIGLGPAAVSLAHEDGTVRLGATVHDAGAGYPVTVRATLPLDGRDARLEFDGGRVSLAALGLREGTAGLVDLDRAGLAGHAAVTLDQGGRAAAFDVDVRFTDVAIDHRRLAAGVVRGLDFGVVARGTLDEGGALAVDEAKLSVGGAALDLRGRAKVTRDAGALPLASLDVRFSVPDSDCDAILGGLPEALAPNVHGVVWDGRFEAHGRFAFDARKLDELTLDYAVDDRCKVKSAPEALTHAHFEKPFTQRVYDPEGRPRDAQMGPGTPGWTPLGAMSRWMPIAVILTEDGGAYRGSSFNWPQVKLAVVTDLEQRRFARGASTLLMQLAKNLYLARDKTIARKLEQVLLTEVLSQTLTKEQALELYLNVVEFGPDLYGVRDAALHYFGKGPWGLTFGESLALASMLPSPVKLHALKGLGELSPVYMDSIHHLMDVARLSGLASAAEVEEAKKQPVRFAGWSPPAHAPAAGTSASSGDDPTKRDARLD